jgi:hypothetical protein
MGRERNGEPGTDQASDRRIELGPGLERASGVHVKNGPLMPLQHTTSRLGAFAHGQFPRDIRGRYRHLSDDESDHLVEQIILALHVVTPRS